jgi:hypothetical protein
MYVIDTDYAVDRMLQSKSFGKLDNLEVWEVDSFDEYMEAIAEIRPQAARGDWIICDLFSNAWEEAQNYFSQETYGKDMADYFLERKAAAAKASKSKKSDEGFEGASDWGVIKPLYKRFAEQVLLRNKAHVLITTGQKPLSRSGAWADKKEIIEVFDSIGFKPEGEKRTAHYPHTILHMRSKGEDEWAFTTVKDREREVVTNRDLSGKSFAKEYLLKIAGWKVGRAGDEEEEE